MTSNEAPGADDGASKVGPLPFDVTKAHQARMYDYYLGVYALVNYLRGIVA